MLTMGSPSTCFGESLKAGTMRLAEFCAIKSVGLLIIFIVDVVAIFMNGKVSEAYAILPISLVLISIAKIFCNYFLYMGARNGNATYLKPWFWVYSIQTGLLMLAGFGGVLFLDVSYSRNSAPAAIVFLFLLIYCTAFKYFCQVVLGLIREMERGHVYDDAVRPVVFTNDIA